mmetsp:Transcript_8363/g.37383  ORF Transcript_8363/g.37383 Transcript_8363/m.37383 type:complete len:134 (+) Transcript_8363:2294-2695(+)
MLSECARINPLALWLRAKRPGLLVRSSEIALTYPGHFRKLFNSDGSVYPSHEKEARVKANGASHKRKGNGDHVHVDHVNEDTDKCHSMKTGMGFEVVDRIQHHVQPRTSRREESWPPPSVVFVRQSYVGEHNA